MDFLKSLFGFGKAPESAVAAGAGAVIDSLGEAGDKLFTSDEERAYWAALESGAVVGPDANKTARMESAIAQAVSVANAIESGLAAAHVAAGVVA